MQILSVQLQTNSISGMFYVAVLGLWGVWIEYAQVYWDDELCIKFVASTVMHRFIDSVNYSWT